MSTFVFQRLIHGLIVVLGVTVIVFFVTRIIGDPVQVMLPIEATIEDRQLLERQLGLDRPIAEQFVAFVRDVAVFDFGESLWQPRPAM